MVMITHHQIKKGWMECIGRVEAVLWNGFSLTAIVYNVLIVLALKEDSRISSEW